MRLFLCPPLETLLVQYKYQTNSAEGQTHPGQPDPGLPECDNGQLSRHKHVIQKEWSPTGSVAPRIFLMAYTLGELVCHQVQQQTIQLCIPSPRTKNLATIYALSLSWENLNVYIFSPVLVLRKVVTKVLDQGYKLQRMILFTPGCPNCVQMLLFLP